MLFTLILVFAIVVISYAVINTVLVSAINTRFMKTYEEIDAVEIIEQ